MKISEYIEQSYFMAWALLHPSQRAVPLARWLGAHESHELVQLAATLDWNLLPSEVQSSMHVYLRDVDVPGLNPP
jgi:hypothetical protein